MQANNKKTKRLIFFSSIILLIATAWVNTAFSSHEEKSAKHHANEIVSDSVVAHHDESKLEHAETEIHAIEEKIKPGEIIMGHVTDAHDWHIATIGHKHISIPLPIIIYGETGLKLFSSSRFEHGHANYEGYKIEGNHILALNHDGTVNKEAKFYDLSITKIVAAMFFAVFVLCWIMLSIAKRYRKNNLKAPKGIQSFVEPLIIFLRDEVVKPSIGPKYEKFLPYLLTIFFFIFINNLFGLIPFFPGGANVTGNIAVTLILALGTFIITCANTNKNYWMHIINTPGVPWWLKFPIPLMPIVEIIGVFSKPFVLMLRLFANITAGHIIILGFMSLIFIFGEMNVGLGLGVSLLSVAFSIFMNMLELLVAFLQAYVFTLLSALYFGMALEEHHNEESH